MESSAGSYVTSYDTGSKPFNHDTTRGRWASNRDFYIACVSHAFGIANFSLLPVFIIMHGGVFVIIPYLISMCLFTLPIFFIQSFLGQFSSTGFISVFRISPLFKGIGYVILLLNIVSACINSITASYTLAYFFASFSIELPWMSCNHTWNDPNCTEVFVNGSDPYGWYDISWSTVEYFQYEILNFQGDEIDELRMSWPIFGANIVVWIVVGCVLHKGMDSLTKFMRYSLVFIFGTMFIVFLRFSCFPDAMAGLLNFITPTKRTVSDPESWIAAPFLSVLCFGTGWGTVLTMASFNKFNVNITRSSVLVNLTTLCGSMLAALIVLLADDYLQEHLHFNSMYFKSSNSFNFLFIGFPYLFGNLEASQMWSMLFFLMLTVCELNAVILIIFTTLTAAFDEYEFLRTYKKYAYLGTPAVLFLFSIAFATNHGFEIFSLLIRFSGVTQMGLCFIEIIMLVWIYGRLRFQRDVQFMLGTTIRTWMIYLVRFITPLYILFVMMGNLIFSGMESYFIDFDTFIIIASLKFLPWIIIPLYMLYKLYLTTGSFKERFRRNTRPNDWYPAIANDRQRYEEALGTADISHQLMYIAVEEDEYRILHFAANIDVETRMAWPVFGANILVWIIVGAVLSKGIVSIAKYVEYSLATIIVILFTLFVRFACLPGAVQGLSDFIMPPPRVLIDPGNYISSPFLTVLSFGTGWGTILTLASFNKFNTNIIKSSFYINLSLMGMSVLAAVTLLLADEYLKEHMNFNIMYFRTSSSTNFVFVGLPFLLGNLEAPQMWSLMYFLMLTLCEMNSVILIIFVSITAVFDEYPFLRKFKQYAHLVVPAGLFLFSIMFATNHGYEMVAFVLRLSGVTQMGLCFVEIIVLVWVYGRLRFQRDVHFMLRRASLSGFIYLTRFITPLFILFVLLVYLFIATMDDWVFDFETFIAILTFKFLPWILIPGFMVLKLFSTTGTLMERIKKCIRPNDWYPAAARDRQKYEDALGSTEISHQLMNLTVEDDE